MSGTTISNSYVTGIVLTDAGTANNPLTILSGVTISDPASRAIYGTGTIDWTIANSGSVLSAGTSAHSYGIALVGGTITNAAGGVIAGGYGGVVVYTTGTVINHGSIASTVTTAGAAIALIGGGAVANGAGAVVSGAETGIGLRGVGAVTNTGTVRGLNGSGVLLSAGGAVANNAGGTIIGYLTGVSVDGTGTVVNQGSIISTQTAGHGYYYDGNTSLTTLFDAGVLVTNAGVDNGTAGVISSYFFGIGADQPTTVVNQGQISGSSTVIGFGVFLLGGGRVTNAASGTIFGGLDGVLPTGSAASTVINQGHITAAVRAGIDFFSSNSYGSNAATGTIIGNLGVLVRSTGQVINAGSIGGVAYGIDLVGVGTVSNAGSAQLSATVDVLELAGGTVINQGTMTATGGGAKGVYLDGAGYVSNAATGSIISSGTSTVVTTGSPATSRTLTGDGILVSGGLGTVLNSGSVASNESGSGAGIRLKSGGSVSNAGGGTVTGAFIGVQVYGSGGVLNQGYISGINGVILPGAGTLNNQGVIISGGAAARAVYLYAGGYVSNATTGTISSAGTSTIVPAGTATKTLYGAGIYVENDAGTVVNAGSIVSTETAGGAGIRLGAGGTVSNAASGTISSGSVGVLIASSAGTVVNSGSIAAAETVGGTGIDLTAGGTADNAATGRINSGSGIVVESGAGTVTNYGSIVSVERLGGAGIELGAGGTVTNGAGAVINTQLFGVQIYGSGTVLNSGTIVADDSIKGYGAGVWIHGAADVSNASGGTIGLGLFGVVFYQDSTLFNSGAIVAAATAVTGKPGYFIDLVVTPGATFTGIVDGGNALTSTVASALELSTGSGIGTITGFGSKYVDFKVLDVEDGASWSVAGTFEAAQTIDFVGAGVLTLTNPGSMAGVVDGFSAHDTIVLAGITGVSAATLGAGNLLTVARSSGPNLTFQFDQSQSFSGTNFNFVGVGGATDLTVPCFAAGTRIATPAGEVAVEQLCVGDNVLTRWGARRTIVWLGHRRIDCRRHPRPAEVWPVRVCAGAFGAELPHRDLLLSPDHAVLVDEALIPIRYLLNDATIVQQPAESVTYWHVELAEHDVVLAEGLSCESYLDTGNRGAFANGGAEVHLNADFARKVWKVSGCAPLVVAGAELAAARLGLLERAATLGHATTTDAALRVVVDGCELVSGIDGRFRLPAGARQVRLCSRSAVPAHMSHGSDDHRRLGVAVARIVLDGEPIALDDRRLGAGWHNMETQWRWTEGDASLDVSGVSELELEIAISARYWQVGNRRAEAFRLATPH